MKNNEEFLVAMRPGDTPVPIPNTTVKARTAEGTLLETARESRWLPEQIEYDYFVKRTVRSFI